jgi:VWFA-related protein
MAGAALLGTVAMLPRVSYTQRSAVCLVATAADRSGRPVSGLTAPDIRLFSDGRPQSIDGFTPALGPASLVVLLDISGSVGARAGDAGERLQSAATEIMDKLAGHRIRFGRFAERTNLSPGFTQDRGAMLAFVQQRELLLGTWSRIWDAADAALAALAGEQRPVLMLISDGNDTDSLKSRKDVERRAQSGCVPVYSLGVRSQDLSVTSVSSDLPALAAATGGKHFSIRTGNDIAAAVAAVEAELSGSQYVLTLIPAASDGKRHKLAVEVARPDVTLRIPTAYYAPK